MRAYRARKTVIRLAWVEAIILDAKRTKSLKRKAWHKRRDKELAAERLERERLANLPSAKFWCGAQLPDKEALAFIKEHVLPAQPEAARKYLAQVAAECRKHGLNVNTYTLKRGGVQAAQDQRRLCWSEQATVHIWSYAAQLASRKTAADIVRHRDPSIEAVFEEYSAKLGNGATIAAELDKPAF
ncbi:MAG: hypothetical protein WA361_19895 [Candidatus Acidiferrales bacterium]